MVTETKVVPGHRERTAASVLERTGLAEVAVLNGGPADWADAAGPALEAGA